MTLDRKRARTSVGDIAYLDEGDGPPVVLLHGYPTSSHLWRDLVPMLAPHTRAIAPDLMGYGDSAKPDGAALDIRAQAGYVRELLEHLGVGELAVVGHDIGGGVAQLLALEGGVKALVLIDSISFDSWPIEGVKMIQDARPDQVDEVFAENFLRAAFTLGLGHPDRLSEEDLEAYVAPWRGEPFALIRAARGIDGIGLAGADEALAGLDVPALVLWGEDDPYLPVELAERLGEALPGSTVALLPGCSHFLTEDARETVLPMIVEWLRTLYLGKPHVHHGGPAPVSFERPERGDGEA